MNQINSFNRKLKENEEEVYIILPFSDWSGRIEVGFNVPINDGDDKKVVEYYKVFEKAKKECELINERYKNGK